MDIERLQTEIVPVDAQAPDPGVIARAAGIIRAGGLVAFPTETVYGLGAAALDAGAVAGIFLAKGRPATNPLIVHVADTESARAIVTEWPDDAELLTARFWPGPLTLVLPRRPEVPDIVTAGGPTVAVRNPAHPVALALIRQSGTPVAAPSANRSEQLSPTRAEHVARSLRGRVALILDAGPTAGGLESTVLAITADGPLLLRPGLVTPAEIEAVIGPVRRAAQSARPAALASPGAMPRHYAPNAPLEVVNTGEARVVELATAGDRVGWLTFLAARPGAASHENLIQVTMPPDAAAYAARLYDALHQLDAAGVTRIVVDSVPAGDAWLAIRDRLRRASAPARNPPLP
jgi:L-threonylcarbamoyladenylate synthase